MESIVVAAVIVVLAFTVIAKSIRIVPQKEAWIVERLGKYSKTLGAGLHLLVPFIDNVSYKQELKECAIDVPPQQCVTKDNIIVEVDGLLYLQVVDPVKASYGISDYLFACSQLAQTTLRSEVRLSRTLSNPACKRPDLQTAPEYAVRPPVLCDICPAFPQSMPASAARSESIWPL